ncbi:hypothetical protein QYF36_026667 [Acer negundo]|nr:hypothetical protein QYF36_026667 [Acer negundo]
MGRGRGRAKGRGRGRGRRRRGHLQRIPHNTSQSVRPTPSVAITSLDSEAMVEGIQSEQHSKRGHDGSYNTAKVRSFNSRHSRSILEPRSFGTEFPSTSSNSKSMVEGIQSEQCSKQGHDGSYNIANIRSFDSRHSRSIPEPRSFGTKFPRTSSDSESMVEGIRSEQRSKMGHDGSDNTANDHVQTSAIPNFTPPVADRMEGSDIADKAEGSVTDKLNGKRVRRPSAAIRTPYIIPCLVKEIVYTRKEGTKRKPDDIVDYGQ